VPAGRSSETSERSLEIRGPFIRDNSRIKTKSPCLAAGARLFVRRERFI